MPGWPTTPSPCPWTGLLPFIPGPCRAAAEACPWGRLSGSRAGVEACARGEDATSAWRPPTTRPGLSARAACSWGMAGRTEPCRSTPGHGHLHALEFALAASPRPILASAPSCSLREPSPALGQTRASAGHSLGPLPKQMAARGQRARAVRVRLRSLDAQTRSSRAAAARLRRWCSGWSWRCRRGAECPPPSRAGGQAAPPRLHARLRGEVPS